jgi:hypothetical protein
MISFSKVKNNPHILEFIKKSEISLKRLGYTNHGILHIQFVTKRAEKLTKEIGLSKEEQEMSQIAAFCHDMGNFLGREHHHITGAILFYQLFKDEFPPKALSQIMEAIACHDEKEMRIPSKVGAVLVLADKSDVRRERIYTKDLKKILRDIHDRVNYGAHWSRLSVDKRKRVITLKLKIDTKFVPIMEYFEIFTERMILCRKAAQFLGYKFHLEINNFKLL